MRLFGHPVHPILVAFPIALLGLTPVWDLLASLGLADGARPVAYYSELSGLIGGGLAVLTGAVDLLKLLGASPKDADTPVARAALVHAGLALTLLCLFGIAFALRGGRTADPSAVVVALEWAGAICLGVTGWFGGHLVFGYGVGVDDRGSTNKTGL